EAEFLTRTLVGASVWKRLIPGDGLGQALREGGLRAPSQTPPSLLWIGVPVCDIPVALRHRERRGLLDVEELTGDLGDLPDGCFGSRSDVERFAVILFSHVKGGVNEGFGAVVDVDEVARDLGIDELRIRALHTALHDRGDQARRVFEWSIHRV